MNIKLLAILILWSLSGISQKVSFTLSAPRAVEVGETFQITYTVNASGKNFAGPTFTDFDYLGGPFTSTSSSMQIINGSMSRSESVAYTYQLRAKKAGQFNLPSASIVVEGKKIVSNVAKIEVVSGTSSTATNGTKATKNSNESAADENLPEGLIFGRTIVNKKTAYVGEPIIVTQKIYSEKQITNVSAYKEPSYSGFWKEAIDIGEPKLERESYGNKVYYSVTLQKMILFPQKAGKLELGSFDLKAAISIVKTRKPRDQWEQWMYGNKVSTSENTNVSINSPKVTIDIKPLPENGKPKDFNGIVGQYSLTSSIDKKNVEVNDALTLKIKISGSGNIDLVDLPQPVFPTDFEVYEPKTASQSTNSAEGVKGYKSYEYLIIPRNEGEFIIDPISITYFDIISKKYLTVQTETFKIKVGKGIGKVNVNTTAASQNQVKLLAEDIRFIKSIGNDWQSINYHYFNSKLHIISLLSIPILLISLLLLKRKRQTQNKNIAGVRNKRATRLAQKRLRTALKLKKSGDSIGFYNEISRVLWGYLSDKFNLAVSALSMDNVKENLAPVMDAESIEEIIKVLNDCEYARFAPNANQSLIEKIYDDTLNIISKIEKSLKS